MRLLYDDKPPEGGGGPQIPTPSQLKSLVDQAIAGSSAAQKRLDQLVQDVPALVKRIEALEAAALKKQEEIAPAAPPAPETPPPAPKSNVPWFWRGK